jgi:hypothetical protein
VKVLDLVGQGWKVPVRGCPLLLTGGLLDEQLPFPVAQRCRVLEILGVDGGLLIAADLRDLLVEDAHVRSCTHAILNHLAKFGTAPDGRLFDGVRGGELPTITYRRA